MIMNIEKEANCDRNSLNLVVENNTDPELYACIYTFSLFDTVVFAVVVKCIYWRLYLERRYWRVNTSKQESRTLECISQAHSWFSLDAARLN